MALLEAGSIEGEAARTFDCQDPHLRIALARPLKAFATTSLQGRSDEQRSWDFGLPVLGGRGLLR